MQFLVLRILTHSELGFFKAYRRAGKEVSKQRAINFDGDVVDRLFPAAKDSEKVTIDLSYLGDDDKVVRRNQVLKRQGKNWRLTGECVEDKRFDFVEPDCIFAMRIDTGRTPAHGAWTVFAKDSEATKAILATPESSALTNTKLVALYGDEGQMVEAILAAQCPELFGESIGQTSELQGTPLVPAYLIEADGTVELSPDPSRTIEMLASVGYTLPSAVADLVDNAISAGAANIDVTFGRPDDGHGRWLSIVDDGVGMDQRTLMEAMRVGSRRDAYESRALGKYGYGLKGASWSQADKVTVVTRKQGEMINQLTWDRQFLQAINEWKAQTTALEDWEKDLTVARLASRGTAVLWTRMRPPAQAVRSRGSKSTPYETEIGELDRYLGMVFHRFIEARAQGKAQVNITINGRRVEAIDPMMAGDPLTLPGDQKWIQIPVGETEARARFQTFILASEQEVKTHYAPQGEALVQATLRKMRLDGRMNEGQGFYVYRNDRLISSGGWRDLFGAEPHLSLLRATLDFDSDLDDALKVNISKREVTFPFSLSEQLKMLLKEPRADARKRYGNKPLVQGPPDPGNVTPVTANNPSPGVLAVGLPMESVPGETGSGSIGEVPASPVAGPTPTSIRKVRLSGQPWKVRTVFGNRVIEVDQENKRMSALHAALNGKDEASAALADLLEAVDSLPGEHRAGLLGKMGN